MHHAWCCADAGAGAIISSAAMKRASFQDVEDFALNIPPQSGDSLTHKIFWQVMDLAPTDPGTLCLPIKLLQTAAELKSLDQLITQQVAQ